MELFHVQHANAAAFIIIWMLMNRNRRYYGGSNDGLGVVLLVLLLLFLLVLILALIFLPTTPATVLRTNSLIHTELTHPENGDELGTLYARPTHKAYLPKDSTNEFKAEWWIASNYRIEGASVVKNSYPQEILIVVDENRVIRFNVPTFVVDSIIVRPDFEKINIGHPPDGLTARN